MTQKLTVLCAARLQEQQLERHLEPLQLLDRVERILLVRHAPAGTRLSKVEHIGFADRGTAVNTVQMFRAVDETLRKERVDWVLGFNPIPWGSVAWAAARRHSVRVAQCLLGSDYERLMHPLAKPLWHPLRAANAVTVPGKRMRRGLIEHGVAADHIHVLPHAIDTERFRPGNVSPDYDIVFVGQLVPVKRVDVLIDAVAQMRGRPRVAIVGEGSLREAHAERIVQHGLADRVELLGFRSDVEHVLQRARIAVLTSESEGLPFAMIEAMACGLVPVVTDVGAVGDVITDGVNGRLVAKPDPRAFAHILDELLADDASLAHLRSGALQIRDSFSMPSAVAFWSELFDGS
jgi:glycosyltransferase involved in cell wall biosynthesis